jgi:hypothetical protein
MDFRIRCEVQRAGNKDRERIWAGNLKRKYPDTATNCTALNAVNEQAFKIVKKANLSTPFLDRYDLAAAVNVSAIDSSGETIRLKKCADRIDRAFRLAMRNRSFRGIRSRKVRNEIYYYKNNRLSQLQDDIELHKEARDRLLKYIKAFSEHLIIIPYDLEIPSGNPEDVNAEAYPEQYDDRTPGPGGYEDEPIFQAPPQRNKFSQHQLTKARLQCHTLYLFLKNLVYANESEVRLITDALHNTDLSILSNRDLENHLDGLKYAVSEHRIQNRHLGVIAGKVLGELRHTAEALAIYVTTESISVPIIRKWWTKFTCSNCKGIQESQKIALSQVLLLEELEIVPYFKMYMRTAKNLSVESCKVHLENLIRVTLAKSGVTTETYSPVDHLSAIYNISYPLSKTTVWRWMHIYGAKWDSIKKNYYTDNHDSDNNIKDRLQYLLHLQELSKRMPIWARIPVKTIVKDSDLESKSSEPASESGASKPESVKFTTSEQIVHVDSLEDDFFVAFRQSRLQETGLPGDFCMEIDRDANGAIYFKSDNPTNVCKYNHEPSVCKCNRPLIHMGQDEAAFKQNQLSSRGWLVDGIQARYN